jgi:hypothetical protein
MTGAGAGTAELFVGAIGPRADIEPNTVRVRVGEARVLGTQVEPGVLDQFGQQRVAGAARVVEGRRTEDRLPRPASLVSPRKSIPVAGEPQPDQGSRARITVMAPAAR